MFDKLGRDNKNTFQNIRQLTDEQIEKKEKDFANKSYSYFKNDMMGIEWYLKDYLKGIIHPAVLKKMNLVVLNYVPRIVKRLTLVYKKPLRIELKANQDDYKLDTIGLDKMRKEFHRQAKLFNTILVRPIWIEDKQEFQYLILHRGITDVILENTTNEIMKVTYQIEIMNKGQVENINIHWTNENHWATDMNGKQITFQDMPDDDINPYGVIPFVVLKLEDSADFWGDGLIDVVNGNEVLNARLTDTFYKLYMNFGVPVGTNLGIDAPDFYLSPTTGVFKDGIRSDQFAPKLEFVTPEQNIEQDKQMNDWYGMELASSKGLPSSNIRYTSGFDRMVDNFELLDLNEDDKAVLREFEFNLFEMMQVVGSVDNKSFKWGNTDIESLEFVPIEFSKTTDEIWTTRENELKHNISTPRDWIKEDSPDMSDEDIDKRLKENKELNNSLKTVEGGSLLDRFKVNATP